MWILRLKKLEFFARFNKLKHKILQIYVAIKKDPNQSSMFFSLSDTLNQKHPLYLLVPKIDWDLFERKFSLLYCLGNGMPANPIRIL